MKKLLTVITLVSAFVFACSLYANAQGNTAVNKNAMENITGMNSKALKGLEAKHFGSGEIVIASAIAKQTNQPVGSILALRKQGLGWGEIAQKYNLKLGEVMKSVHASINAAEKNAKETHNAKAIREAQHVREQVQNEEKMNMREMMENRNQEMNQHENMLNHRNNSPLEGMGSRGMK